MLTLTVYRQGERVTVELTVGEQIQQAINEDSQENDGQNQQGGDGQNIPSWGFPFGWN